MKSDSQPDPVLLDGAIAVTGMACRVPGATTPARLWRNLMDGVESIRDLSDEELEAAGVKPSEFRESGYVRRTADLEGMEFFDHEFFGIPPREAAIMDPQHRQFLECSWEALESAATVPSRFDGRIGVFAGCGAGSYLMFNLLGRPELVREEGFWFLRHTSNDKDFLATRVAYAFGLEGPAVNVQTACSTSLAGIHLGVQSLLNLECDMALAGGVTIRQPPGRGYRWREGEILSPDGHCRPFDRQAGGTVVGDGVGVVTLRRLEDALADGDPIVAVIRGSTMNNDGSRKVGFLAPSVDGQAEVVAEALAVADVTADSIGFVEAHGTGTPMGDPIEVAGLTRAYGGSAGRAGPCLLGSIKSNIGHLDTASGVVGFIKAALAVRTGQVPPTLHFSEPNPELGIEKSPFRVSSAAEPWPLPDGPRRAGVSSLGVGGTNVHVILEEAPVRRTADHTGRSSDLPNPPAAEDRPRLFMVSARTPSALERASSQLVDALEADESIERGALDMGALARTLRDGRQAFSFRRAVVARTPEELAARLIDAGTGGAAGPGGKLGRKPGMGRIPPVADVEFDGSIRPLSFLFAGGGAQYPGMASGLHQDEPGFRASIEAGLDHLATLDAAVGQEVRSFLLGSGPAELDRRPAVVLPALFLVQHAQAVLWMSWGVQPRMMIGHSMGEYTAACLAGVFSFHEALELVLLRGQLFEEVPSGGMLAVSLPEAELVARISGSLDLAAVNGPELCVVSGPSEDIEACAAALEADGVELRRIHIDVAAHSSQLDSILDRFRDGVSAIDLKSPKIPVVSSLTGRPVTAEEVQDPDYWVRQLRHTVRFGDGLSHLLQSGSDILLEVGPGRTLASLARIHPHSEPDRPIVTSMRHPGEEGLDGLELQLLRLGQLWGHGVDPSWEAVDPADGLEGRPPVKLGTLPTYPFEGNAHYLERQWPDPGTPWPEEGTRSDELAGGGLPLREPDPARWIWTHVWRPLALPRSGKTIDAPGPSSVGQEASHARGVVLVLASSPDDPALEVLAPHLEDQGHRVILRALPQRGVSAPERMARVEEMIRVQLESKEGLSFIICAPEVDEEVFEGSFLSVLGAGRALARHDESVPQERTLLLLSRGALAVEAHSASGPSEALLAGPARVLPREVPGLGVLWLDLPHTEGEEGTSAAGRRFPVQGSEWNRLLGQVAPGRTRILAFRDGRWLEEDLAEYPLTGRFAVPEGAGDPARNDADANVELDPGLFGLPPSPSVLITGGSGGIGQELASRLTRTLGARVSLLSRSRPPLLDELAGGGSRGDVHWIPADVTDRKALDAALAQAGELTGSPDLVLHAAGRLDDGLVALSEADRVAGVLAPKVEGTQNLLQGLLARGESPRVILFSSTSARAGIEGQVDYTAANAALDAMAGRPPRADGYEGEVVSLAWSAWRQVGMAAARLDPLEVGDGPVPGAPVSEGDDKTVFRMKMEEGRTWLLDDHRLRDGPMIVPGAGFLELARGAVERTTGEAHPSFRQVLFRVPFIVQPGSSRWMEIHVATTGPDGWGSVQVLGSPLDAPGAEDWTEHVSLEWRVPAAEGRPQIGKVPLDRSPYSRSEEPLPLSERPDLELGARWTSLRQANYGEDVALLELELPDAFATDLVDHALHPALLDQATAGARGLFHGGPGELWVPASYGSLVQYEPLTQTLFSRVERRTEDAGTGLAVMDITILDPDGRVLVFIEEFVMVRIAEPSELGTEPGPSDAEVAASTDADLRLMEEAAVWPEEGWDALLRILAHDTPSRLVVSPVSMPHRLRALDRVADRRMSRRRPHGRSRQDRGRGSSLRPDIDTTEAIAALESLPEVAEGWVTAHEDRPGELRLVAHWVSEAGAFATASHLRRELKDRLSPGDVPSQFVERSSLPRTAKGAVDPSGLDDPFAAVDDHVAPETPVEQEMAAIWQDLLGVDRVGRHDNFLDLGGHSLLVMRAIVRIEREVGVRVTTSDLNMQTLEQIAHKMEGTQEETGEERDEGTQVADDDESSPTPRPVDEDGPAEPESDSSVLDSIRRLWPGQR